MPTSELVVFGFIVFVYGMAFADNPQGGLIVAIVCGVGWLVYKIMYGDRQ